MTARRISGFWVSFAFVAAVYLLFLLAMLAATASYSAPGDLLKALGTREIQHSILLSLITCSITAILSLLVAVPTGYLLARARFPGKNIVEAALDIPIVLPPMVMGLCLLILFQTPLGQLLQSGFRITYTVYAVILAQFVIGAAFAVRTMRGTFDHLSARPEDVAMTLGCTRAQAFWLVTLPAARRGMFAAASVAWARSMGEFGPILVFAGATRMKTEVLPTTVWLELSVGNLEAAVAVSLLMVIFAMLVLVAVKRAGERL
jgi:molybdate transport system permease protein